ncbi:protein O-mannosyl-transferase Tmtc3, partial [Trichonephila clavipes]
VEPNDIGAYINVGRTHTQLGMYEDAEKAFRKAKDLLPRPPFGEGYEARVAPSHLNVFLNLANLISRNGTRLEEADKWLATLIAVPKGLGSISAEGMDVSKCIVPLRHEGTLNSRPATSPLVGLGEREERWGPLTPPTVRSPSELE